MEDIFNVKNYYYDLPEELIAQDPLLDRTASRLFVLDKEKNEISHKKFANIVDYLEDGDVLVINDTKVIPARLFGSRNDTKATVEILLLKRLSSKKSAWECLVKPGKKARVGDALTFGDGILEGKITSVLEDGNRIIEFSYDGIFEEILDKLGQMPLPPYITHELIDRNRYQTVYAKYDGSAAAPTAGLHFNDELLEKIFKKGVKIAPITLHVGLGTFRPVKVTNILEHKMHSEHFIISKESADLINSAKERGKRVISVGTTSTRCLESAVDENGKVLPKSSDTSIFIYPGYKFKVVDSLITNFHLPESTLIMLVSAFAGYENTMNAYNVAVKERYRFFSFGDAMFIK